MRNQGPITGQSPVQFSDPLPPAVEVVIVGAGVIGISTALYLAERGISVLVVEKGRVAGEQSCRNWGWIRQTGRDSAELPIMIESLGIWSAMQDRTGEPATAFQRQGVTYLSDNDEDDRQHARFRQLAAGYDLECRLLSSAEVSRLIPNARYRWQGALHTPSDGRVEPWHAVPAMARAAHRSGALIRENCAVRSLDTAGGNVRGIVTEHGLVRAEQVLVCAGAWSSRLLQDIGLALPQLSVRATVARLESSIELGPGNAADGQFAFCRRADGGYSIALDDHHDFYIGPAAFRYLWPFRQAAISTIRDTRFYPSAPAAYPDAWRLPGTSDTRQPSVYEQSRVLDPPASRTLTERMLQRCRERFGDADYRLTHAWAGMIDTMPDFVPVIDRVAAVNGLFLATGFSGHGFGIGPAVGRILSCWLSGEPAGHDMNRFRYARFAERSRFDLGPH